MTSSIGDDRMLVNVFQFFCPFTWKIYAKLWGNVMKQRFRCCASDFLKISKCKKRAVVPENMITGVKYKKTIE